MFSVRASGNDGWGFGAACMLGCCGAFVVTSNYLLPWFAPENVREPHKKLWKWRNTVNSLLHATVTGVGAVFNLWATPEMRNNLIEGYSQSSLMLTSFTVGYFIYDFMDMYLNNYKKRTIELLLHHALVAVCFGLALLTTRYQGYAMVSLIVELNSIFLHLRQLAIIQGVPKTNSYYKINSYLNIFTFLFCRLLPLGWQTRWLYQNQHKVPRPVVLLGFTANTIILILNTGLLIQVVYKDFIKKGSPSHEKIS